MLAVLEDQVDSVRFERLLDGSHGLPADDR
jgi:hypothetical protein